MTRKTEIKKIKLYRLDQLPPRKRGAVHETRPDVQEQCQEYRGMRGAGTFDLMAFPCLWAWLYPRLGNPPLGGSRSLQIKKI